MFRYITFALLLATGPAGAAMYKWTDDQGNVHYSQAPPPDRKAKVMAPPPKVDPPAPSRRAGGDGAEEEQPPARTEEQRQLHKQNCEAARQNLEMYQKEKAIKEGDQIVQLDQQERARRLEETRKQIAQYCNDQ